MPLKDEWFRTGDLAVQHPNGRVELKDREKDIIIRCVYRNIDIYMVYISI